MLDRLAREGLIRRSRSTTDRRVAKVRLTPAGHDIVEQGLTRPGGHRGADCSRACRRRDVGTGLVAGLPRQGKQRSPVMRTRRGSAY
ncbi:winged helix DNA-binding protein [Actinoplanes campanulatus]|uniref:winged helix DNA-binding protein n=1 Tax=Actinoplanes campanulatus TaxID=113559 RepID=UPI0016058359|nr:winged helix DNA-binding protein [Actinoplanes campanulatus]